MEHISCPTRESTLAAYIACWKMWHLWWQGYGYVGLSHPNVPSETDFLSLWHEYLMAETIRGYRPALASMFKYSGCSVFDSPEIAALLTNFTLERPLQSQEIRQ